MASARRTILATVSGATGAVLALGPIASAQAAPATHVYQHGLYAQAHYASPAACKAAAGGFQALLKAAHATSISVGQCHLVDMLQGTKKQSGYLVDITYRATKPRWRGDVNLGKSPAATAGAHSFRDMYSSAKQSDAAWHYSNDVAAVKRKPGGKVTASTGVKRNIVTGRYEYEIDYNSRTPTYANHVQISERPNVTSRSLGITAPIPTQPGTNGKKPGDATMGNNSAAKPPATTKPPTGPITTPAGNANSSGTVTTPSGGKVGIFGIDISGHTGTSDWAGWRAKGTRFMYIKATEGTYYKSPKFADQYSGAYSHGIIRGAYHFANPQSSTGADQADFFVNRGGGWSGDGQTLPGVLDMEYNPYPSAGNTCYNLTKGQMDLWIRSFVDQYRARTGVNPMIYTSRSWWNQCVGTSSYRDLQLWVAQYSSRLGALPTSWSGTSQLIWQNADVSSKGYDTNIFNGTYAQLAAYASTGRRH